MRFVKERRMLTKTSKTPISIFVLKLSSVLFLLWCFHYFNTHIQHFRPPVAPPRKQSIDWESMDGKDELFTLNLNCRFI